MSRLLRVALLLLICGVAFWWRLGYLGLIDPDEPFYAQSSREMFHAHDWVTPRIFDRPQFEKPVFIYWLSMGSLRLFGDNEFAVRAPAALFASLLVLVTWAFGARAFNRRMGLLSALVLATSVEYFVSARMILTDMVFAAFVCGSAFSLWLASRSEPHRDRWFVTACAMSAVAVLTKGPLGLLIPALAALALWLAREHPLPLRLPPIMAGLAVFAAIAVPWYVVMLKAFGRTYFDAFFLHENVERFFHAEHPHNNHVYYYPAVLIAGSIPWMPVVATLVSRARRATTWDGPPRFLILWMLLCLGFFTLAQSKLPSYVLFLFVPLALLMGQALDALMRDGVGRFEKYAMWTLGATQVAPFLGAPRIPTYRDLAWPLALVAACLVMALILQMRRSWVAWIALTVTSSLLLPVVCLTLAGPAVDAIVSTRALSKEILRGVPPPETLIASPHLVRGVFYYTHRPVIVLSDRAHPFYTPHPLPVVGSRDLNRYLIGRGAALTVLSAREWARVKPELKREGWVVQDALADKIVARIVASAETPPRVMKLPP